MQVRINMRHDAFASQAHCGAVFKEHEPASGKYDSMFGRLVVGRSTYRRSGVRSDTVVPLELEAGLIEWCTPAFAQGLALGLAKEPMRSYLETLQVAFRWAPPRATAENKANAIAARADEKRRLIEPSIRATGRYELQRECPKGPRRLCWPWTAHRCLWRRRGRGHVESDARHLVFAKSPLLWR